MRDIIIKLSPFEFISIIDCKIIKSLNKHATLEFTCRISKEQEDVIFDTSFKNNTTELSIIDESGSSKKIFIGIIKNFYIQNTSDSRVLKLYLISTTYLMDTKKKIRVFQNKNSTYDQVLNKLNTYDDYSCILSDGSGVSIEKMIVQYNETDFEFVKRLASHFNTSICPAYLSDGVKFYLGIPKNGYNFELPQGYTLKKELKEDLRNDEDELPFSIDKGNHIIEFSHRDVYEIGDYTFLKGQKFTICKIVSFWTGNELLHNYHLKEEIGQYVSKYYNNKIIGSSLNGHITAVTKDKVKIYVHEDGIQDSTDFLSYSTVYSSPDGTGWYCMPEENDSIRMYFPSEKEHHGYAISAVHTENEEIFNNQSDVEVPRSNPDNKSLKSKYGKEVLFTPTKLHVKNNKGMEILIDDDEGITITSDLKISINSSEKIDICSIDDSVHVIGNESILLEQADAIIELKDNIIIKGAQTLIE